MHVLANDRMMPQTHARRRAVLILTRCTRIEVFGRTRAALMLVLPDEVTVHAALSAVVVSEQGDADRIFWRARGATCCASSRCETDRIHFDDRSIICNARTGFLPLADPADNMTASAFADRSSDVQLLHVGIGDSVIDSSMRSNDG